MELKRWIVALVGICAAAQENGLEKRCLSCHRTNQIPDTIIYRRYLQTYSSPARIVEAMEGYIRRPSQARSIMPRQFFYKFPMKPAQSYDPKTLKADIEAYIRHFDVKKRLRLRYEEEENGGDS